MKKILFAIAIIFMAINCMAQSIGICGETFYKSYDKYELKAYISSRTNLEDFKKEMENSKSEIELKNDITITNIKYEPWCCIIEYTPNHKTFVERLNDYNKKDEVLFGISLMGLPLRFNSWAERKTNGLLLQIDFFPLDYFSGITSVHPMQQLNSYYDGLRTNGHIASIKDESIMFIRGSYYSTSENIGSVYGFGLYKDFEYRRDGMTLFRIHFLRDSWLFNSSIGFGVYEEKVRGGIYDTSHNHIGWSNNLHQVAADYGFNETYKGIGVDFQIWCLDFMYYHSDYSDQFFVSFGYPLSNILYWCIVKDDGFLLPN